MQVLENKIWITEEPADGAQASKHGSGLPNTDKQGEKAKFYLLISMSLCCTMTSVGGFVS